jgi:NAD(P)-dependent dehydrogenase (short-subunit alcohol dehydrogenase family)
MRVVITGANRGIGRALFDSYTARGDEVTGTARSGAEFATLNVNDPASINAFAASFENGSVDLLICNAGVFLDKGDTLATGYAPQDWASTFQTNVAGVFLTIQAMLPKLSASGAKIAIMSSQMGSSERAGGGGLIYRASKAAALNLGRNLAVELAPKIAVGIYHPGWVQTDMGGTHASITVDTSAAGLIERFDTLCSATTGCFEMYNGEAMPY